MPILAFDILCSHDTPLIRDCAQVLEQIPKARVSLRHRRPGKDDGLDAILTIKESNPKIVYAIECKRHLAPVLEPTLKRLRILAEHHGARPMILALYVNDALGERLRAENIDYVDAVGNAYLHAPPLMVFLRGRKPDKTLPKSERLFHGVAGLRLIALLLTEQKAVTWPYRDLAKAAGLSLGSASQLMGELRRGGYFRTGAYRLANTADLLEQWMLGYHRRLRPKIFQKTYRTTEGRGPQDLIPFLAKMPDVLIGGELAASITTKVLRPARATLHVPSTLDPAQLIRQLRLLPDAAGNIDVLTQFGDGNAWKRTGPDGVQLIAPLLVYAELLQIPDDRLRETARAVYDSEIAPHVPGLTDTR